MNETEARIRQLRRELDEHNYNYYVLNAPKIDDREFDRLMAELQRLEEQYPEYADPNSPTCRVGNDHNRSFTQVKHRYPMLSFGKYLHSRGGRRFLRAGEYVVARAFYRHWGVEI